MRILWTINMLMPNAAKAMGLTAGHAVSWIDAMSKRLSIRDDNQVWVRLRLLNGIIHLVT